MHTPAQHGGTMRFRSLGLVLLSSVILMPASALAQQEPVAPDGTSRNEAPAAGPAAAVDACGHPVMTPGVQVPGAMTQGGAPANVVGQTPVLNPKDDNVGTQQA